MKRHLCEVKYLVEFEGGGRCFCGAGFGVGGVDRTFLKTPMGRMIVPGSHMKGLARQRCEELLETVGVETTSPHDHEAARRCDNLVSRLFGRPGPENIRCVFSDLEPPSAGEGSGEQRQRSVVWQQVRMNRRLGRPEHQALFDTEYSVTAEKWHGSVTVWLDATDGMQPELTLVCAGLRLIDALGGGKSTGAGTVKIEISEVRRDGLSVSLDEVLSPLADENWPHDPSGGKA